jgi:hypothetical protein
MARGARMFLTSREQGFMRLRQLRTPGVEQACVA